VEVLQGPLVTEVHQKFSDWASHVIRLYEGKNYVEVEWTAGPIPIDTPWIPPVAHHPITKKPKPNHWGKEVVVKYASGLKSQGTWFTDSNGKEMVKRVYNKRGPSYPHPYNISEPVAGNYYPVNALMSLDDGTHEMAVLTDVSQAGASLADGELELMVHRRVLADDSRGVQEPLNETMCGCNDIGAKPGHMGKYLKLGDGGCWCEGLTVRGRHWLVFDTVDNAHEARRQLSETLNFPPTLGFTAAALAPAAAQPFSAVSAALPPNVKLVTLTNNYASHNAGQWLLRLSHLYQAGEHPTLAQPATVDLQKVFAKAGLKIAAATETTLTGNRPLTEAEKAKHKWRTHAPNDRVADHLNEVAGKAFEQRVPFAFPSVTLRPMEVRTFLATFT
jgi:alpha-mannosidase